MALAALYALGLAVCTAAIWAWCAGARQRRFDRAFPLPVAPWAPRPFVESVERAYRLRAGSGWRLPGDVTPMALYLTLYPSHCIYDMGENERFLRFLRARGAPTPGDLLTTPLKELAHGA